MKKIVNHTSENREAGFTLIEVLIALAIFSMAVVPLMASFTMSARLNMRGRQKEQAMTVAENVVEGVKAVGVASSYEWCTGSTLYSVIPDNADGSSVTKSATRTSSTKTVDLSGCEVMSGTLGDAYKNVSVPTTDYTYQIKGILMGGTLYDVIVTAKANTSDLDLLVPFAYSDDYSDAGVGIAMLYDIVAEVTLHDSTGVFATYSSTVVTQR